MELIFAISLIMFALPISMPRCKRIYLFYQNSPKIKFFLQKKMQIFLALGAPPPDPIVNFWLRARVIELLSGSKYITAFDISNLRCACINTKIIITPPLS